MTNRNHSCHVLISHLVFSKEPIYATFLTFLKNIFHYLFGLLIMRTYDPNRTHFRDLLTRHQGSDEFFTRIEDIERELSNYPIEQWQGKRVLCSCDSPTSAFTRYFHDHYHRLGLAHLTATCIEGTRYDYDGTEETIT